MLVSVKPEPTHFSEKYRHIAKMTQHLQPFTVIHVLNLAMAGMLHVMNLSWTPIRANIVVAHAGMNVKISIPLVAMGFRLVLLGRLTVCRVQKEHFPP